MTKDQRNTTQDRKLTLRASQNARDLERSRLGQRNAQRYLDTHSKPLHYRSEILATSLFILTTIFILLVCLAL